MSLVELVNDVAREICNADWGKDHFDSDILSPSELQVYRHMARAAVEALVSYLRNPTAEMLERGRKAWKKPRIHVSHSASDEFMTCAVIWGAMLDAAIKDATP